MALVLVQQDRAQEGLVLRAPRSGHETKPKRHTVPDEGTNHPKSKSRERRSSFQQRTTGSIVGTNESNPRTTISRRRESSSGSYSRHPSRVSGERRSFASAASSSSSLVVALPKPSFVTERGRSGSTRISGSSSGSGSGSHKIRTRVRWTCNACTFFNDKDCGVSTTKATILTNASSNNTNHKTYSISELVRSLGVAEQGDASTTSNLPPSLERRVQDFRFAQQKRREKYGDQKPWGIYGLYAHLSDIRADLEWAEDAAWRRRKNKPYLSWKDFDSARDEGLHSRPYFTYGVMALCTIFVLVTLGVNGWKFEPLTINPLIGPSSETLIKCGARDTNLIVNEGQWFRLFTPMILHAGLVHYLVNMLAMGNILSAICLPGFISVGASGGIFGLIGGCMADICLNWNLLFLKTTTDEDSRTRHLCVLLWLAADIIVNCLLGFTPFVDNFTHLGGFLYGFCIGFASIERLASGFFGIRSAGDSVWSRLKSALLRYFGLVVSVVTILATTVVLAQSDGVTSPCHGCRYISCVPFPFHSAPEDKWWHCDDCGVVTADLFVATDGSGLYQQVNIHCPNGETEEIPIAFEQIYDKELLRRLLPSYCRDHCAAVFANGSN
eukprot:jgi/Psemu1/292715/fgenesh1_pg.1246_\